MKIYKFGVVFDSGLEVLSLFSDRKAGSSYLVRGSRGSEVEVRVTPQGRIRVSSLKARTNISVKE